MKKRNRLAAYLIEADRAYSADRSVLHCFSEETGEELPLSNVSGDTLALFIGREMSSVYDETMTDEEQRAEFFRVLENAEREVRRVADCFGGGRYGKR